MRDLSCFLLMTVSTSAKRRSGPRVVVTISNSQPFFHFVFSDFLLREIVTKELIVTIAAITIVADVPQDVPCGNRVIQITSLSFDSYYHDSHRQIANFLGFSGHLCR